MNQWIRNEKIPKYLPYVLSFLIPFLVMGGICVNHGIYPFGENCFLHIDMYHQYAPFYMEFLNKLQSHSSLLYSWNLGLGSDFVSTYTYYLASPINWLLIFCPKNFLIEFMTILILLKVSFSGLFFAIYLGKHFKTNSIMIPLVAMFYALSAYFSAYNWNIMWLDGVMLLPLIVLGLERLVYEKKSNMYCILLAVTIWSNYYIAMMICVFLVLYFVILQLELKKNISFCHDKLSERRLWRREVLQIRCMACIRFATYSIIAAGFSAVLIIPEMKILGYSGSNGIDFPKVVTWYFSALEELARQCAGVTVSTGVDHWPNLYCGVAVMILFVLYILNRKISLKSKILRVLLLGFFLVSFAENQLDFIWHGLHYPDSLPGRQAFLYIFILLVICFETLFKFKGNSAIEVGIALTAAMAFLLCCALYTDKTLVNMDSFVMTAFLLGAYAIVLVLQKSKDKTMRMLMLGMAFFLTITEATLNLDMTGIMTTSRTLYVKNLNAYEDLTQKAKESDKTFFRTEKFDRMTKNESSLSNYASASLFSSLMNISVGDMYRKVGMEGGKNFYCYNGATPIVSSMLSVKYMLTSSGDEESPLRSLVANENGTYMYRNTYSLPLGFMVDSNFSELWNYQSGTSVQMLNNLGIQLGAESDMLLPIPTAPYSKEGTTITVAEDSYVYATYANGQADTITATIGNKVKTFIKCTHSYILDLGWCKAGTTIKLYSAEAPNLMAQAYKLDLNSLDKAYATLNNSTMKLKSYSDAKIQGSIEAKKAGNLILSIPNESGWQVLVDGKKVKTELFMNSMMSIPLTEGRHEIKLVYITPGIEEGAAISLGTLILFLFMVWCKKRRSKNQKLKENSKNSEIQASLEECEIHLYEEEVDKSLECEQEKADEEKTIESIREK